MVSDPWWTEKGNDVPTLLSRFHDTHPQVELDDITLDGRRQKVKVQVARANGNRHCSGTRRKLCEGEGRYWMGLFGDCF